MSNNLRFNNFITLLWFSGLALSACSTTPPTRIHPSYLGAQLGSNMSPSDHQRANEVLESGSENRSVSWVNSSTQRRFSVTPTRTFKKGNDDCRDYTALYGGRTVSGIACREEDGTWLSK